MVQQASVASTSGASTATAGAISVGPRVRHALRDGRHVDVVCGVRMVTPEPASLYAGFQAAWWHMYGMLTTHMATGWHVLCSLLCILMGIVMVFNGVTHMNVSSPQSARPSIAAAASNGTVPYKCFSWDTACYPMHICNERSWFYELDESSRTSFSIVGPSGDPSEGTGSVVIRPIDLMTGEEVAIMIHDVAYLPNQPHNLLSHSTMRAHGFVADFEGLTVSHGAHVFQFQYEEGFFHFSEEPPTNTYGVAGAVTPSVPVRDRSDWMWVKSEYDYWAPICGGTSGDWTHELFWSDGNRQGPPVWEGDAFTHEWTGQHFYGNPVYENAFIMRTMEKALHDFENCHEKTPRSHC